MTATPRRTHEGEGRVNYGDAEEYSPNIVPSARKCTAAYDTSRVGDDQKAAKREHPAADRLLRNGLWHSHTRGKLCARLTRASSCNVRYWLGGQGARCRRLFRCTAGSNDPSSAVPYAGQHSLGQLRTPLATMGAGVHGHEHHARILLGAKRQGRIGRRGSARRQVAGQQRDAEERQRRCAKADAVPYPDAEHEFAHDAAECECHGQADE